MQQQFEDILHSPGGTPGGSRKRNFGAKPKLWDAWITLDDLQKGPVNELADIKPLSAAYVPQQTKSANLSMQRPPSQERLNERSTAFLSSLFANPPPRNLFENDHPGDDPSEETPRKVQVSVVISMPTPKHGKSLDVGEEEFPNIAIGFTRLPATNT